MTTPTPAAQALMDLFTTQDPERMWDLLPSVPLIGQDYAPCHALEQGWDGVATQVLRRSMASLTHSASPTSTSSGAMLSRSGPTAWPVW